MASPERQLEEKGEEKREKGVVKEESVKQKENVGDDKGGVENLENDKY